MSDPKRRGELDARTERALGGLPDVRARREFKDRLREQFVRGELVESGIAELQSGLDDVEEPQPSEAFKTRLRSQFVSGEFAKRKPKARPRSGRAPAKRRSLRLVTSLGLAAAAVLAIVLPSIGGGRQWEIIRMTGGEIGPSIVEWQRISTEDDLARLSFGDDFLVEISGRSSVTRVAESDVERLEAQAGSINITSREGDDPIVVIITTPDALIEVSSNSVGIDVIEGEGTCICVLEGEVKVTPRVGDTETFSVGPGKACFVKRDGSSSVMDGLMEPHQHVVEELRAFAHSQRWN